MDTISLVCVKHGLPMPAEPVLVDFGLGLSVTGAGPVARDISLDTLLDGPLEAEDPAPASPTPAILSTTVDPLCTSPPAFIDEEEALSAEPPVGDAAASAQPGVVADGPDASGPVDEQPGAGSDGAEDAQLVAKEQLEQLRADIEARIAALESEIEAAAAVEDYDRAEDLNTRVQELRAEQALL